MLKFKSSGFVFTLVAIVLVGVTPIRGGSGGVTSGTPGPTAAGGATTNKFVGRWASQIKKGSREVINDGVLEISDTSEPSAEEVSVVHSVRGGPVIGYTMSYPDRIEIQISLGDGRVAHYNGVLVSANRIEGRFFVTGNPQSHHARKLLVTEDAWQASGGG